jgi:hypothetical protein
VITVVGSGAVVSNPTMLLGLVYGPGRVSAGFTSLVRQDIATLDSLCSDVASGSAETVASWLMGSTVIQGSDSHEFSMSSPMLTANSWNESLAATSPWFADFGSVGTAPWSVEYGIPFVVGTVGTMSPSPPPAARRLPPETEPIDVRDLPLLALERLDSRDVRVRTDSGQVLTLLVFMAMLIEAVFEKLQMHLLLLLNRLRASLHLIIRCVRVRRAAQPGVTSPVLLLIATSRRFGHRGEPDDHGLPVLMPISVVIGRSPVACS